jgi:hypothetical protein
MKLLFQGDKSKAICENCGPTSTTFFYKDVVLSESKKLVKDILAGMCDSCGSVVSIPSQSTPAIKKEREKATLSIEAVLPAPYIEVLDMAAFKISNNATTEMRKYLILAYLHKHLLHKKKPCDWMIFENLFKNQLVLPMKRLSIKVSPSSQSNFLNIQQSFNLSKTDTIKAIVAEIKLDILDNNHIEPEIETLAKFLLYA